MASWLARHAWCWCRDRRCCIPSGRCSTRCWPGGRRSSAADCWRTRRCCGGSGYCADSPSSPTRSRGAGQSAMWRTGPAACYRETATRTPQSAPIKERWPASWTTWSTLATVGRPSARRGSERIRCRSATSGTPPCTSPITKAGRAGGRSPARSCRRSSITPTTGWAPPGRLAARAGWRRFATRLCSK
jgi:hypothetical protein